MKKEEHIKLHETVIRLRQLRNELSNLYFSGGLDAVDAKLIGEFHDKLIGVVIKYKSRMENETN